MSPRHRYIAIEGPIGAGKTTLARRLAERLDAEAVLEQPGENPFLARFYQDMARYALPTQLFFLFQRVRQLEPLAQADLFGRPCDRRLPDRQGSALRARDALGRRAGAVSEIYDSVRPQSPTPGLVIYLQARPATLIERVRKRAAGYERGVSEDYLALLAESYARFFHHYADAPLLIVNSENLNFVARDADFNLLVQRLLGMKSPREFFSVG
jgi:deoxyadenosine/deoxycytidine kinase